MNIEEIQPEYISGQTITESTFQDPSFWLSLVLTGGLAIAVVRSKASSGAKFASFVPLGIWTLVTAATWTK